MKITKTTTSFECNLLHNLKTKKRCNVNNTYDYLLENVRKNIFTEYLHVITVCLSIKLKYKKKKTNFCTQNNVYRVYLGVRVLRYTLNSFVRPTYIIQYSIFFPFDYFFYVVVVSHNIFFSTHWKILYFVLYTLNSIRRERI